MKIVEVLNIEVFSIILYYNILWISMPRSGGLRSATRDLFSVAFKRKGHKPLKVFLRSYKLGDYVDIKVNGG